MIRDLLAELREAAEMLRAEIPRGELKLASVEGLLKAAEAVCAVPPSSSNLLRWSLVRTARRKAVRDKWAGIAKAAEDDAD